MDAVGKILMSMNITPDLRGFEQIIDCIYLFDESPRISFMDLCTKVGNKNGVKRGAVERNIRYAMHVVDKTSHGYKEYVVKKDLTAAKFIRALEYTTRDIRRKDE